MPRPPAPPLVRLLGNPTNRALIAALQDGPSFPRALAARLHVTEGQAQKHLHQLAVAGIVSGGWHHDIKTVKLYHLRVRGAHLTFREGTIAIELEPPVGPKDDRPSA